MIHMDDYLEVKCLAFPRLYCLGREDLLELLAGAGSSAAQAVIGKLFPGVCKLEFGGEKGYEVHVMGAAQGEQVPRTKPAKVRARMCARQWGRGHVR